MLFWKRSVYLASAIVSMKKVITLIVHLYFIYDTAMIIKGVPIKIFWEHNPFNYEIYFPSKCFLINSNLCFIVTEFDCYNHRGGIRLVLTPSITIIGGPHETQLTVENYRSWCSYSSVSRRVFVLIKKKNLIKIEIQDMLFRKTN